MTTHYALKKDILSEFISEKQVLQFVTFPRQTFFAKIPGGLRAESVHPGNNILMYLAMMIILDC